MKKMQLKKLVMAGLVAGAVIASQGVVNASEGECVMVAGAGCGGGCGAQKRNLTTDNTAPQKPSIERPATQEEIEAYKKENPNHEQELQRINQNNANQPVKQGSCHGNGGCKGKSGNGGNGASCSGKAPR